LPNAAFPPALGIAEYLFKNEELLEESIETALYDKTIRGDDLEFHSAVREWSCYYWVWRYGRLQKAF
jgi:hypothetical protein